MTDPQADPPQQGGRRPRYDLVELIATGGMGQVWRAEDTVLHRDVAVKLLKAEYSGDSLFHTRFEQEARLAAGLQHPHVASVLDYGEREDPDGGPARPMLVMELVEGRPLSRLIGEEWLTHERAADLVAQAGEGLAAAHRKGIVHRDVKPGNLLVTDAGHVKVTDFGIARAADAASLTLTGHLVGTPHYLSPEQAEGGRATAASDVYALGVVLFECLTGTKPFESDSPVVTALRHVRDPLPPLPEEVPDLLRAVVDRACTKDPARRFADAGEMAAAIRGEQPVWPEGEERTAETPVETPDPATRVLPPGSGAGPVPTGSDFVARGPRRRRGRGRWVLAAVVAALVLALFAWAITSLPGDDPGSNEPSGDTNGDTGGGGSDGGGGTENTADTVQVDESDYVGRPEDEAVARLRDLGLDPVSERRANPGGEEAGTVAAVRPTGEVEQGAQVTLEVWEEPADTGNQGQGQGNGNGNGNGNQGEGSDEGPLDGLPGQGEG